MDVMIAHHEAGHVVACLVLGVKIEDCWINCEAGRGQVNHRNPVYELLSDRDVTEETYNSNVENAYFKSIIIALAGPQAQRRYDPQSISLYEKSIERDRDEARRLVKFIRPSAGTKEAILADCETRACNLVSENWPQIMKLATALLKRQRLTGDEVDAVLASH